MSATSAEASRDSSRRCAASENLHRREDGACFEAAPEHRFALRRVAMRGDRARQDRPPV
jgi:hypothetical protein